MEFLKQAQATFGNKPAKQQQQAPQQDALDKGVDTLLKKAGHGQSAATTEKISDGIRGMFKKVTGKDIPIADKS